MLRLGLIGWPVSHSLSPELYAERFGSGCTYELVETQDFDEAWEVFAGRLDAVNVTAPFKEAAFVRADFPSGECVLTRSANLLVKCPEGVRAFNTDYLGVRSILKDRGLGSGDSALVIGYGGAGRSAAAACRSLGMSVTVCNRGTSKAEGIRPLRDIPEAAAQAGIVIYTIPVPVEGISSLSGRTVLEANYRNPSLSGIGCGYIGGTVWLRAQAEAGFEILAEHLF